MRDYWKRAGPGAWRRDAAARIAAQRRHAERAVAMARARRRAIVIAKLLGPFLRREFRGFAYLLGASCVTGGIYLIHPPTCLIAVGLLLNVSMRRYVF